MARVEKLNIVALAGKSFDGSTLTFNSVKQWVIKREQRTRANRRISSRSTSTSGTRTSTRTTSGISGASGTSGNSGTGGTRSSDAEVTPIIESNHNVINQVTNNINNIIKLKY